MIAELCKGVHCVDLGESFPTHIHLQNLASIQPRTSPFKFARSPRTDPPGCFHFSSLSRRQEWLSAPVAVVRALLSDDRLRVRSEDEVYNAAIAWLRAREPPADANVARDLLALVRYSPLLTVPAPAPHADAAPRSRRGFAACLYALGGKDGEPYDWNPSSSVERYDPVTDLWVTVEPMGTARLDCFGAVLDGKIYVAGGIRAKSDSEGEVDSAWASLALVECYDLRSV